MEVEESSIPKEDSEPMVVTDTPTDTQEMETVPSSNSEQPPVIQIRDPETRPVLRLSVKLIETYKHINKIYYEAKAKKLREQQGGTRGGVHNDGYDDQHYDYLIHGDEIFAERYILKHRIGKGSFGQVVCAYDRQQQCDVAIKIIKSKHAFAVQAKTEIRLLELTLEKDFNDDHNIVRLLDTFVYRKHQCLVFEMLSYNLYELLKNTKFRGVSLALVRKFAKQILRGLDFLCRKDVDIIHCDLKPENILLRHPKRSAIKIIDFGSSCLTTKKMYTYIQSRFYRSPEVLLGLPYSQKIDMWSLGCVLVEMHTGEPLFGGVDQLDQLNRIVNILGMVPPEMVADSPEETRKIFFEKVDEANPVPPSRADYTVTTTDQTTGQQQQYYLKPPKDHSSESSSSSRKSSRRTLEDVIGVTTGGPQGRRKDDVGHSVDIYILFATFIRSMLIYQPALRASANEALSDPYLLASIDFPAVQSLQANSSGRGSTSSSSSSQQEPKQQITEKEKEEEKEKEKEEKNITSTSSTTATVGSVLPRRRARSAPRLTSTDGYPTQSSSRVQDTDQEKGTGGGGGGGGMVDVSEHSAKKLTMSEASSTKQQLGLVVGLNESGSESEAWVLPQKQGVGQGQGQGESDEGATTISSSSSEQPQQQQQQQQQRQLENEGPMETSEVDDEGGR